MFKFVAQEVDGYTKCTCEVSGTPFDAIANYGGALQGVIVGLKDCLTKNLPEEKAKPMFVVRRSFTRSYRRVKRLSY